MPCLRLEQLVDVKSGLAAGELVAGEEGLRPAFDRLFCEAGEAMQQGPFSVTFETLTTPGGGKYDYMSIGPYWWPDPRKPDGMPYIRRDGEINPQRHESASGRCWRSCGSADALTATNAVSVLLLPYRPILLSFEASFSFLPAEPEAGGGKVRQKNLRSREGFFAL